MGERQIGLLGMCPRFGLSLAPHEADLSKRGIGLVVLSMGGERRRGDLGTRDHAARQREGIAKAKAAGKYRGRPGQDRCGADQAAEGHVGSRCDREAARHCPEFGLPRARKGSPCSHRHCMFAENRGAA
jgi:hypothetical protein